MHREALRALLEAVKSGSTPVDRALDELRDLPFSDLGFANVDHHRALRTGLPEVVFGPGKTLSQLVAIVREIHSKHQPVLVTRLEAAVAERLREQIAGIELDGVARTAFLQTQDPAQRAAVTRGRGPICVVTAGTSDMPVAREAIVTARAFGNEVSEVFDVGVAGLHRLLARRPILHAASVVIVIAGMEGALASVVGGLVDKPVIAVPTSVGYGASFQGLAALLSMLNSCASGVTVVNVDNGFGAAYAATLINQAGARP
jgi:pyridinium-3,5-biscarboxylic acid mononucleotide synthase